MGNRAVITTACENAGVSKELGVYLHWNGGRDSVEAFLAYCKLKGYRSPDTDNYGWARLCQAAGNFFGGSTSIGIDRCDRLDCNNFDNGVYIIKDWEIVDRQFFSGFEQREYSLQSVLNAINEKQPVEEQLEQSVIDTYCNKIQESPESGLITDDIFNGIKSMSELKKKFRELSKIHHPDHGGKEEDMKKLNTLYRAARTRLDTRDR